MSRSSLLLLLALGFPSNITQAQDCSYRIDSRHSSIQIHLGKAGLFRFLGDEHEIEVRGLEGEICLPPGPLLRGSVHLKIDAGAIRVLDPHLKQEERQEVQRRMEGKEVLDRLHYPFLTFRSLQVHSLGEETYLIAGELLIRDRLRRVSFRARVLRGPETLQAEGGGKLRLSEFGIGPIGAGGGTVRVRDTLDYTFRIVARPAP